MNSDPATRKYGFKEKYQRAGFTLAGLSAETGINRAYLSLCAQGRYNLTGDELELVAKVLDASVEQIS